MTKKIFQIQCLALKTRVQGTFKEFTNVLKKDFFKSRLEISFKIIYPLIFFKDYGKTKTAFLFKQHFELKKNKKINTKGKRHANCVQSLVEICKQTHKFCSNFFFITSKIRNVMKSLFSFYFFGNYFFNKIKLYSKDLDLGELFFSLFISSGFAFVYYFSSFFS